MPVSVCVCAVCVSLYVLAHVCLCVQINLRVLAFFFAQELFTLTSNKVNAYVTLDTQCPVQVCEINSGWLLP